MNPPLSHGDRAAKIVKLTLEHDEPDNDSSTLTTMLSFESRSLKVMPSISTSVSSVLVDLNLMRNQLTELPDEIGDFVTLQHLNISRNAIRLLPHTLGNLCQLV
jgi:Leucine-rich repeat (LRR) protein